MTGGIGLERIDDEACLRTLEPIGWPSRRALPRLRRQVLRRWRTDMSIGKSQGGVQIARPRVGNVARAAVAYAIVATVMLGCAGSPAATAVTTPAGGHTLHVTWHRTSDTSTSGGIDLGSDVMRADGKKDQIGTATLHCSAPGAGGSGRTCKAEFTLADGTITAESVFSASDLSAAVRSLAVTAGTGAYQGATGKLTVRSISQTDEDGVFEFDR